MYLKAELGRCYQNFVDLTSYLYFNKHFFSSWVLEPYSSEAQNSNRHSLKHVKTKHILYYSKLMRKMAFRFVFSVCINSYLEMRSTSLHANPKSGCHKGIIWDRWMVGKQALAIAGTANQMGRETLQGADAFLSHRAQLPLRSCLGGFDVNCSGTMAAQRKQSLG